MLGEGIVSFGVTAPLATSFRKVKSSAKIVSRRRTGPSTCNAAVLNSMTPSGFSNRTLIASSGAEEMPPSR